MTISAAYAINQDMGNGTTVTFAVNFPFGRAADLAVTLFDTVAQANVSPAPVLNGVGTYDYTVTGTPDADTGIYPNGSVVFNTAPLSTWEVVRARATLQLQELSLGNNTRFPAKSVEGALDRAELQLQEMGNVLSRMPIAPPSDPPTSLVLPPVAVRKGKFAQFDATTGALGASDTDATDIANAGAAATAAAASATAAAAAEAEIAANLTIIESYGLHKGANNIFDVMPSSAVSMIQARSFSGYLDTYINIALAAGGAWIFPAGEYHLNTTMTIPPAFQFIGCGRDVLTGTVIFPGGTTGAWGGEQLNANGTQEVEAYSMQDIFWQVTQNGFRWNSVTGGFDDTSATQKYMMRPRVERCGFNMDNATRYRCLQTNKAFNVVVRDNSFVNFLIPVDLQGSDMCDIWPNRFVASTDTDILANSHGTFGSNFRAHANDHNNPAVNFIRTDYLHVDISNSNHFELDGGSMTNMVDVSGNCFDLRMHGNRVDGGGLATNWLKIAPSVNRYSVSAFDNITSGTAAGVDFGLQPYFNNGGGRCLVRHGGNTGGDAVFPMNCEEDGAPLPFNTRAMWTAGRRGLHQISYNPMCLNGDVRLEPIAGTGSQIEISDFDLPVTGGPFDVYIIAYSSVASQVMQRDVLDGASSIGSGSVTLAANSPQIIKIYANASPTTALKVRLWNADTVRNGQVWVRGVYIVGS